MYERFWEKVEKSEGCWLWIGAKNNWGYGRVRHKGKQVQSHRLSWMIENGSIPEGKLVLHKCDVPACVNPVHLFLGTSQDNAKDMMEKGRRRSHAGSHNPNAKMSDEFVAEVRKVGKIGSYRQMASMYGVSAAQLKRWLDGTVR